MVDRSGVGVWCGVGMGLLFVERLAGEGVFKCRRCRVDAASKDAVISKDFYGRSGRAYLFDHVYVRLRSLRFSLWLSRLRNKFSCAILGVCPWKWANNGWQGKESTFCSLEFGSDRMNCPSNVIKTRLGLYCCCNGGAGRLSFLIPLYRVLC